MVAADIIGAVDDARELALNKFIARYYLSESPIMHAARSFRDDACGANRDLARDAT